MTVMSIVTTGQISMTSTAAAPSAFSATGGTKSTSGAYTYHLLLAMERLPPMEAERLKLLQSVVGARVER